MFERGVVEIFRQLSWHYKTNLPVRFGKRVILTHGSMLAGKWEWASPSFSGTNKLDDLVRVMSILDGKPEPDHRQGTFHRLNAMKWPTANVLAELDYFSVRGFKNGNCHLTFTRGDLVDELNAILAKHHPNALPPARGDAR